MRNNPVLAVLCVSAILFISTTSVIAEQIVPVSYVAPPGHTSSRGPLIDVTGRYLCDDIFGCPWRYETGWPGNGPEWNTWVGWCGGSLAVSIVFRLPGTCTLTGVNVFTGRDTTHGIHLPQSIVILALDTNGDWTAKYSAGYGDAQFADGSRHTLSVPLHHVETEYIRLDFITNLWFLVNEIQLFGIPAIHPKASIGVLKSLPADSFVAVEDAVVTAVGLETRGGVCRVCRPNLRHNARYRPASYIWANSQLHGRHRLGGRGVRGQEYYIPQRLQRNSISTAGNDHSDVR